MTSTFEVRVEGELAVPTVRRLGCRHCVAEAQTVMRIEATATELHRVLKACSEQGLTIESVLRVSRVPAHVRGGPRRLDG